jgi:cysteine synthase
MAQWFEDNSLYARRPAREKGNLAGISSGAAIAAAARLDAKGQMTGQAA